MPPTQYLQHYLQNTLTMCEQGHTHHLELKTKPSKIPILTYTLRLFKSLQFYQELIVFGLFLAKKLLQKEVFIPQRCLYKLITISLILADKLFSDEHHSMETYSLLSCIPIKELVMLQAIVMETMEFQLIYDEREMQNFKRNELIHLPDQSTRD